MLTPTDMANIRAILGDWNPQFCRNVLSGEERSIFFPLMMDHRSFDHFILALLVYDRVCVDLYQFITRVLFHIPRKYHQFLLDLPFLDLRSSMLGSIQKYDIHEFRPEFMNTHGYNSRAFDRLFESIFFKARQVGGIHPSLAEYLGRTNPGICYHVHNMLVRAHCNHLAMTETELSSNVEQAPETDIHMDFGSVRQAFGVSGMPGIYDHLNQGSFDLPSFIALRDKRGAAVLRELVFHHLDESDADALLREYNDILVESRTYTSRIPKATWGIGTALSLIGLVALPTPIALAVAIASVAVGSRAIM